MTDPPKDGPLQFSLGTLMAVTVAVALLLGMLRWFHVSTTAIAVVMAVLVVGVIGAVALLATISRGPDE